MRSTKESITLPLLRNRWELLSISAMVLCFAVFMAVLCILDVSDIREMLSVLPMFLIMAAAGAYPLVLCALRLHLVPDGAAVSLFGRTLARYPAERLTLIRWDADQLNGPRLDRLVLSALSLEELAARRERALRSNGYYASGVDRRKRHTGWQDTFALEQIRRMTRLGGVLPIRKRVLWLQDSPETQALLKLAFPDADWANLRHRGASVRPQADRKRIAEGPESFRRSYVGEPEPAGGILLLIAMLVPTMCLMIPGMLLLNVSETFGLVIMGLAIFWMMGTCLVLGLFFFGNDRVSLESGGILVRTKLKTARMIPAGELKTAFRIHLRGKGGDYCYLSISTLTGEELVQMEEARMSRTRLGREELSALRLLDNWPELALWRLVNTRAALWGYEDRTLLLMACTDEREAWLRERYPHVEVLDFTENYTSPMKG